MTEHLAVGYFDDATQESPTFDPGLDVLCPHCLTKLSRPLKTISLMPAAGERSFFYRTHRHCHDAASDEAVATVEGAIIDAEAARAMSRTR